jgi:hypothetical protein
VEKWCGSGGHHGNRYGLCYRGQEETSCGLTYRPADKGSFLTPQFHLAASQGTVPRVLGSNVCKQA